MLKNNWDRSTLSKCYGPIVDYSIILMLFIHPSSCCHGWGFLGYRRLVLNRVHKQNSQSDINDAGKRQQRTEEDAEDTHGFVSAQIFAAQHDAEGGE